MTRPVAMSYTWPETPTFGESRGGGEQPLDVCPDGGIRVGDRGDLQCRLVEAGRLGGPMPVAGVGEKAGSALRVVDDRDFEEPVVRDLAGQLLGEVGEVGDVVDDSLGDASPRVADDGSLPELEAEDDRGVDPAGPRSGFEAFLYVRATACRRSRRA